MNKGLEPQHGGQVKPAKKLIDTLNLYLKKYRSPLNVLTSTIKCTGEVGTVIFAFKLLTPALQWFQ
jgi:hypothetical protein